MACVVKVKVRTVLWCLVAAAMSRVASAMQARVERGSDDTHCSAQATATAHVLMQRSSPHNNRKPSASETPDGFNRPVHAADAHVISGAAA
jgi:hypothetical protein